MFNKQPVGAILKEEYVREIQPVPLAWIKTLFENSHPAYYISKEQRQLWYAVEMSAIHLVESTKEIFVNAEARISPYNAHASPSLDLITVQYMEKGLRLSVPSRTTIPLSWKDSKNLSFISYRNYYKNKSQLGCYYYKVLDIRYGIKYV